MLKHFDGEPGEPHGHLSHLGTRQAQSHRLDVSPGLVSLEDILVPQCLLSALCVGPDSNMNLPLEPVGVPRSQRART